MSHEDFEIYDRELHTPPGEKAKPKSRGVQDLMAVFGMRTR